MLDTSQKIKQIQLTLLPTLESIQKIVQNTSDFFFNCCMLHRSVNLAMDEGGGGGFSIKDTAPPAGGFCSEIVESSKLIILGFSIYQGWDI